jgi:hypothetical protein
MHDSNNGPAMTLGNMRTLGIISIDVKRLVRIEISLAAIMRQLIQSATSAKNARHRKGVFIKGKLGRRY